MSINDIHVRSIEDYSQRRAEHASDRTKLPRLPYLTFPYITFIVFGVSARREKRSLRRFRLRYVAIDALVVVSANERLAGFPARALSPMISARFGGSELLLSVGGRVGNAGERDAPSDFELERAGVRATEIRAVFADRSRRNELRRAKFEDSLLPLSLSLSLSLSTASSPAASNPRFPRAHAVSITECIERVYRARGSVGVATHNFRFDSIECWQTR